MLLHSLLSDIDAIIREQDTEVNTMAMHMSLSIDVKDREGDIFANTSRAIDPASDEDADGAGRGGFSGREVYLKNRKSFRRNSRRRMEKRTHYSLRESMMKYVKGCFVDKSLSFLFTAPYT